MRKEIVGIMALLLTTAFFPYSYAENEAVEVKETAVIESGYTVGVDDILDINIIQPEKLITTATVALDGMISFPYIGNVYVKDKSLSEIQKIIEEKLSDGYMKYPVIAVSLRESHSKNFFVYGEVVRPGSYPIEENMTVLRAISSAGGFTKFGSSSNVKVLRVSEGKTGYQPLKVNIKDIMKGEVEADVLIKADDIIVVSEGIF